jgi:ribokinase
MIVVFGSLNADLIFALEELPTPGQTLLSRKLTIEAGGKGANQAVAAARDGGDVVMVGAVGRDPLADVALSNLKDAGVDVTNVATVDAPTGAASVLTDTHGRNMIAVALGANERANASQISEELLARAAVVVLQMESRAGEVEAVIRRAHAAGKRTILNLAPARSLPVEALRLCALLVVNEDEAASLGGWLGCGASAGALRGALGIDVIRTLGADGSEAATTAGSVMVPARPIQPVDTTAAGDCYVGVLAAALDRGLSLSAAMERATAASALACMQAGSQSSLPWQAAVEAAIVGS